MIQRVTSKHSLRDDSTQRDLAYWLSRPPEERVSAVEILRRQRHGDVRMRKDISRVITRPTIPPAAEALRRSRTGNDDEASGIK